MYPNNGTPALGPDAESASVSGSEGRRRNNDRYTNYDICTVCYAYSMMIALLWWGIAEVEDMYEKENKNNSGAGSEKEENK